VTGSFTSAGANVSCPVGQSVTGGGADITGGLGQVQLVEASPSSSGTQFFTRSVEDPNGFSGTWFERGYAICATPLPGLERVATSSSTLSVVTATCPTGKRVVGGGGTVSSNAGQDVYIEDITPAANLTSVTAHGSVVVDGASTGQGLIVTAYAICANPPPGLQLVTVAQEFDSDVASVTATCPAGKYLLGAGGEIDFGFGQVRLDDLRPNSALKTVTVTGVEDETGYDEQWRPIAHAICANP